MGVIAWTKQQLCLWLLHFGVVSWLPIFDLPGTSEGVLWMGYRGYMGTGCPETPTHFQEAVFHLCASEQGLRQGPWRHVHMDEPVVVLPELCVGQRRVGV